MAGPHGPHGSRLCLSAVPVYSLSLSIRDQRRTCWSVQVVVLLSNGFHDS